MLDGTETGATAAREVLRIRSHSAADAVADRVAVEEPLLVELTHDRDGGRVTESVSITMRTPGHDVELALGFLYTEGIVAALDEIVDPTATAAAGPNTVRVAVRPGVPIDLRRLERHFYATSSCGVCGKTSIEALAAARVPTLRAGQPVVAPATVHALPDALRAAQQAFDETGGLHAAALFDGDGGLLLLREDVGRHNAVDKVVGAALLGGLLPLSRHVVLVSGRASFELVQKVLAAGVPILAAVGAPSSLAVDTARAYGATLLGFVRQGRFNVYAGAERIAASPPAPTAEPD